MNQDDGGSPHINVGTPPEPDDRVEMVFVLVARQPDGGEGIYGHKIGDNMHNFVTSDLGMKDMLEKFLRDKGTIEVCRRADVRLEWRKFSLTDWENDVEEIT